MSVKVSDLTIALQSGTDRTVYITWTMADKYSDYLHRIDYFDIRWQYTTGDGIRFNGQEDQFTNSRWYATWTAPSNATSARVKIRPVSKTYTKNGKDYKYFTAEWVLSDRYDFRSNPPPTPSVPTVEVDGYTLTSSIDGITDELTDQIKFYIVQGDDKYKTSTVNVTRNRASFSCTIKSGYKYRAAAQAINIKNTTADMNYWSNDADSISSGWSDYSEEVYPVPPSVTNVKCSAENETEAKVSWTGDSTATGYTVEYAKNKNYFDSSSDVSSVEVTSTTAYITGLETGVEWFFRVKATNNMGESGWSTIVSIVLGTKPNAPTTWSSTTTAMVGDEVRLYWTHNTQDGSSQTSAEVEIVSNSTTRTYTVDGDTMSYTLSLSGYTDGAIIQWRVRTKGITNEFSDWSIQRTINVYAPATLSIDIGSETLTSFPLDIKMDAGPSSQSAVTYFISIIALTTYETIGPSGQDVRVNVGDEVYSVNVNTSLNSLTVSLTPSDLTLANGESYRVYVIVSMNTGLTAEAYDTFTVSWADELYDPDAGIGFDYDSLTAYISPYCINEDGSGLEENVVLSVYRREYDGTLTEIATELVNDGVISVTDPHPSLDYARYRIVARGTNTSNIGFTDLPGYPVQEPSIVVQWDEAWTDFDFDEESESEEPPWTGSLLRLPGNVDVTEDRKPDNTLIEYIGREHPVSYYGTQKGETGSWTTDIAKSDKETLYSLRRLSNYTGDVYVREPSGIGYWAQITINMSQTHCETVVPVSFTINRVEGGA